MSENDRLTNLEKQSKERWKGHHQSHSSPLNYHKYLYKDRDPICQARAVVTQPEWITSGVTQKCEFPDKYGEDQKYEEQADCIKDLDTKVLVGSGSCISFREGDSKGPDGNKSSGRVIGKPPVVGLSWTEEYPLKEESPNTKSAASSYQGWVTTESFLKSNVLTKTTLERLATFRYNSCSANENTRMKRVRQTADPLIPSNLGLLPEKEIISGSLTPDGMCPLDQIPAKPETHLKYCFEETYDNPQINSEYSFNQFQKSIFTAGERCRQPKLHRHDIDPSKSSRASESCTFARDNFESLNECDIELCYITPAPSSTNTGKFCVPAEQNYSAICGQDNGPKRTPCIGLQDISSKNDEYSEGINDLDLLSVFPDIPATINDCELRESKEKKISGLQRSHHATAPFNEIKQGMLSTELLDSIQQIKNEDDFPIDADLEKELFQLQSPMNKSLIDYEDINKSDDKKPSSELKVKKLRRNFSDINPEFTSSPSAKRPRNADFDSHILQERFNSKSSSQGQKEQAQRLLTHKESASNSYIGRPTSENEKVSPEISVSCLNRNKIDEATDHRPFARKNFPTLVGDASPIEGLSSGSFLRVCFRIGELFREAGRCHKLKQAPVMELFARIRSSCQELGTMRQIFQFADIWHDRPPHPSGLLLDCTSSSLLDGSREKIENINKKLVRVLGILKRDNKQASGWLLYIINIRKTDWHEINETRRIIDAEEVDKIVRERKMAAR